MVNSISFGKVASFAGDKLKTAVKDEVAAVKEDIKTPKEEQKVDKFIMKCSDGKDDGKLGFGDTVKSLFGKNKVKVSDNAIINTAAHVPTRSARSIDVDDVAQAARQMRRINFTA